MVENQLSLSNPFKVSNVYDNLHFSQYEKMCLMTFVPSEDSDWPVHPHRLIRMKSSQETIYRELTFQGFQYNTVVQLIFPGPL